MLGCKVLLHSAQEHTVYVTTHVLGMSSQWLMFHKKLNVPISLHILYGTVPSVLDTCSLIFCACILVNENILDIKHINWYMGKRLPAWQITDWKVLMPAWVNISIHAVPVFRWRTTQLKGLSLSRMLLNLLENTNLMDLTWIGNTLVNEVGHQLTGYDVHIY